MGLPGGRFVATRLVKATLVGSGLNEDEAEALIKLVERELTDGRFATMEQRLASIQAWTKAQHSPEGPSLRMQLLLTLAVTEVGNTLYDLIKYALITSYDDIIDSGHKLAAKIKTENPTGVPEKDRYPLSELERLIADRRSLEATQIANHLLGNAFDHFGYYNHGEYLYRKACAHSRAMLGRDHMILGQLLLPLVINLDKQGRHSEASQECEVAAYIIRHGADNGAQHDYATDLKVFENAFSIYDACRVCPLVKALFDRLSQSKEPTHPTLIKARNLLAGHCAGIP
jgi:hypothetical protein